MGVFGDLWKGTKKVVGGVGDVVSKAAPVASLIPGVGPLAAAGLKLGGSIAGKLNDEGGLGKMKVFKEGILPAAVTGGAAYGMDKLGIGTVGQIGTKLGMGRGAGPAGPMDEDISGIKQIGGGESILQKALGAGGDILDFIKKNPQLALAAGNGIAGAVKGNSASNQNSALLERALGGMDARAKQKQMLLEKIMNTNTQAPDLSAVYRNGNPY